MITEQIRNKYNTLTPAEAKKLNRYLGNNRAPIRTASVLHKPRAPPIVVTNLDNDFERQLLDDRPANDQDIVDGRRADEHQARSDCSRNSSIYQSACDRRHSINYGRSSTLNSRQSLFSTASTNRNYSTSTQQQQQLPISSHDSLSNLSFRSSRDVTDFAYESNQNRFQTTSVDVGYNNQGRPASIAYDTMRARLRYKSQRSNTINTKFSDDSFSSAKSEMSNISGRSSSVTPTKFTHFPAVKPDSPRSASKLSLSSSTYKVFQSPLANFKRLFRGIHRPFSQSSNIDSQNASKKVTKQQQHCNKSLADFALEDSVSQTSLYKSQSPTVLPPPPSELKSMCYIESGVNYSNYDEFTRSRNERLPRGNLSIILNGGDVPPSGKQDNKLGSNTFNNGNQQQNGHHQLSLSKSDDSDDSSWQMTSLPVYYERNLTTVFEEKQPSSSELVVRDCQSQDAANDLDLHALEVDEIYQTIKPPKSFEDPNNHQLTNGGNETVCERAPSACSSVKSQPQSLAINSDLALEFHRQQPATLFRFSFAQPLNDSDQASINANLGLPPRMPVGYEQTPSAAKSINSETQRQDNSSSGNSSNCSSQMNGINYCDRQNSLESPAGITTSNTLDDKLSYTVEDSSGYGIVNDLDNDPDTTILSETSTIRGDTAVNHYANKCTELEMTVTTLKNKLIAKEKELTELQLSQLNNDYTIDRLKKQVNKLERENAHLRTMVAKNSNNALAANTISRMQI